MIPSGSSGFRWRDTAFPVEVGAVAIALGLPISVSVYYEAPTGLYGGCVGDFTLAERFTGNSSTSLELIAFTAPRDAQEISWSFGTTTAPGLIDTVLYTLRRGMKFGFSGIEFHHKFESGALVLADRIGLVIPSGSPTGTDPHISIEPLALMSDLLLEGDMYIVPPGTSRPRGIKLMDRNVFGALYTGSFITAYRNDTISGAIARFTTLDVPTRSFIALDGVVVDKELVTLNSGGIGPLIRNTTWGGGLYMHDIDTVEVLGSPLMNFDVPSGSVYILKSLQILSGTLNVLSGSIYLRGPAVTLSVEGTSASAVLIGHPWMIVSLSNAVDSVNIASGVPAAFDGTLLLIPSASTSELQEAWVRASGSWFKVISQSTPTVLDGGMY